jgi:hypothetical protein
MELILKLKTGEDLTTEEMFALIELSRAQNVSPGDLAAQFLREGLNSTDEGLDTKITPK